MANERGGDRRQGRPGGGGHRDFRPRRSAPPRAGGPRGGPPRPGFGDEGPRDFAPRQGRPPYAQRPGGYPPRTGPDEGGMAIRVDPRRLTLLKELAAAEGLRPGQLVQRWVEERLDAERTGAPSSPVGTDPRVAVIEATLATLAARIEEVAQRVQSVPAAPAPRRRGRPPKARAEAASGGAASARVGLHEEIIAVIRERGPSTAAELATAIRERGRYEPPRSGKPLDAATVNGRVSNPVYRARFHRAEGRIGLAD